MNIPAAQNGGITFQVISKAFCALVKWTLYVRSYEIEQCTQ